MLRFCNFICCVDAAAHLIILVFTTVSLSLLNQQTIAKQTVNSWRKQKLLRNAIEMHKRANIGVIVLVLET